MSSISSSHNVRHIRHISSIQVRNLTPFPARDTVASALSQPSRIPAQEKTRDDIELTFPRKRGRKVSANSTTTSRSNEDDGSSGSPTRRRRASSRLSTSSASIAVYSTSGSSAPTIRPHTRPRTNSKASSIHSVFASPPAGLPATTPTTQAHYAQVSTVSSQAGLEKVVKSRLVETFIAVTIPSPSDAGHTSHPTSPVNEISPSKRNHPFNKSSFPSPLKTNAANEMESPNTFPPKKGKPPLKSNASSPVSPTSPNHFTSTSIDSSTYPHSFLENGVDAPDLFNAEITNSPGGSSSHKLHKVEMPSYISPIHQPSTNPSFGIDASPLGNDFASWSDISSGYLKVEVWGKTMGDDTNLDIRSNGTLKGKEKLHIADSDEWKILERWDVDLNRLLPVPKEAFDKPFLMPPNTLFVTLSPPGQTYYLPGRDPLEDLAPLYSSISATSTSMDEGYISDPETEVRKDKLEQDMQDTPDPGSAFGDTSRAIDGAIEPPHRRVRRWRPPDGSLSNSDKDEAATTATWGDLFKLVTTQACLKDDESSLHSIVQGLDKLLLDDVKTPLKREISERSFRLEQLRSNKATVRQHSEELHHKIDILREDIKTRREMLSQAHQIPRDLSETENEVHLERGRLSSVEARLPPTRTTLLTTLSQIYPIELYSPPILLFTIVDIPLPIPSNNNDPAPPLGLQGPEFKGLVDEEKIATALGYAAHVVQLLSVYMGVGLVYPITYIGSRSMIRDGISAMVGPRMFPLFSKGVDTYRFEYGVFLLNKDIELLMAERDLRAMDIRHTLPNLKNLLLTLTSGEAADLMPKRNSVMSTKSVSSLASAELQAVGEEKLTADGEISPSDSYAKATSTSGSATPTSTEPKSGGSSFLGMGLSGFGFLKRNPSVSTSKAVNQTPPTSPHAVSIEETNGDVLGDDDEEDRRTIRGAPRDNEVTEGDPPDLLEREKVDLRRASVPGEGNDELRT